MQNLFKISNDTMKPKISKGDTVIVDNEDSVKSGDLALLSLWGLELCRKVFFINGGIVLKPLNKKYESIFFDADELEDVKILGKVVGVYF